MRNLLGTRLHGSWYAPGATPAALEVDPVDVEVGIFAGQGPAPPLLDRREGFLVEIGHGASRHARPPQGLADVFDAARRHAGQVHLDYGFLYAGLAPFVALDHGGGEAHPFELGHLQRDLARRRCEVPLVVPCAVRGPLVCSLVGACAPQAPLRTACRPFNSVELYARERVGDVIGMRRVEVVVVSIHLVLVPWLIKYIVALVQLRR